MTQEQRTSPARARIGGVPGHRGDDREGVHVPATPETARIGAARRGAGGRPDRGTTARSPPDCSEIWEPRSSGSRGLDDRTDAVARPTRRTGRASITPIATSASRRSSSTSPTGGAANPRRSARRGRDRAVFERRLGDDRSRGIARRASPPRRRQPQPVRAERTDHGVAGNRARRAEPRRCGPSLRGDHAGPGRRHPVPTPRTSGRQSPRSPRCSGCGRSTTADTGS